MTGPKFAAFGLVETVVCPYGGYGRGEHDRGLLEVWSRVTGYPGYGIISVYNTDSRCPPRPTRKHPQQVAEIVMNKRDMVSLRDALDRAIATLPDTIPSNFGEDEWTNEVEKTEDEDE